MHSGSLLPGEAAESEGKARLQLVKKWGAHSRFHLKPRVPLPQNRVKTKLFLLTFPLSRPRKSREALPPLALLGWLLCGSKIEDLLCWALCKPAQLISHKIYNFFDLNKQSYILVIFFFNWLWFSRSKSCMGVPLHYLNSVVKSGTESHWF